MRLAGRRILITGAASGIGRATARVFRDEGAAVALLDRDGDGLEVVRRALAATAGPEVCAHQADVTDATALADAAKAASRSLGGLDGLVGAAGIDLLKPFDSMSSDDWQGILDVNLTGPFKVSSAVLPHLKTAGRGTIVHIASGAALRPLAGRTAYCASKAGLVMFAKALAVDLARYEIRVNAVCPGIIETPLFRQSIDAAADPEAELEQVLDRYLIRRVGRPEDVAYAALYLTSAESAHVTGSTLSVDGGRTFH
jgi:NAD(P)-dependent dehydrogenase (short-subunit alcohol dehydrogenase family)